ncbi:pectin lyase fold/virulence factor [Vibrio phage 2.095.B._10N.286.46.E10]|nr:pectin lyase fold/virulence factor [Vibrio phage 2.095.B._10N.286.46.E10]
MTIPKITPYTGGVANPDGSQAQTEFTQNMFDQLSYEANLSTELNNTVDGINDTAIQVDADATSASQSAAAAEAAVSGLDYQGLWPDTGGSANKGETWQTQTGGTPTGQYFTALQNTTVDPVSDNANWRAVVSDYGNKFTSSKSDKSINRGHKRVQILSKGNGSFLQTIQQEYDKYPESCRFTASDGTLFTLSHEKGIQLNQINSSTPVHDAMQFLEAILIEPQEQGGIYGTVYAKTGNDIEVDFNGEIYEVDTPVVIPQCDRVIFKNGYIKNSGAITGDYVIKMVNAQDIFFDYTNITWRDFTFDGNHLSGCVQLQFYLGVIFDNCKFYRFNTYGLQTITQGHKAKINKCRFAEHVWGDAGWAPAGQRDHWSGVGINLRTPDNEITDSVFMYSKGGIQIEGPYNTVSVVHPYGMRDYSVFFDNTDIAVVGSKLVDSYLDNAEVWIRDPYGVSVTDCDFLGNTDDPYFAFIRLIPSSTNLYIRGLDISSNHFRNIDSQDVMSVCVDAGYELEKSPSTFLGEYADGVVIDSDSEYVRYLGYNYISYFTVLPSVTTPYTCDATTYSNPDDDPNLVTAGGTFSRGNVYTTKIADNQYLENVKIATTRPSAKLTASDAYLWEFDFEKVMPIGYAFNKVDYSIQNTSGTSFEKSKIRLNDGYKIRIQTENIMTGSSTVYVSADCSQLESSSLEGGNPIVMTAT